MHNQLQLGKKYTLDIVKFIDKIIQYSILEKILDLVILMMIKLYQLSSMKLIMNFYQNSKKIAIKFLLRPNYIFLSIKQHVLNIEWLFQSNGNFIFHKLKFLTQLLPAKALLIFTRIIPKLTYNIKVFLYLESVIIISILFPLILKL